MAIQRWDPLRDLAHLQESMNRLFEEALGRSPTGGGVTPAEAGTWRPALDLFEEAGHYVVRADLPGVRPADVDIEVEEGMLVIRGERRADRDAGAAAYLRAERPSGRFSAQVALPAAVDRTRIHANQRNGVLEVVLPKKREAPSRIEVAGS